MKIARIISNIFVPPTFTVLVFIYLSFYLELNSDEKVFLILTALIFGLFLPVIVFAYLRKKDKIADVDAKIKEQRTIPYLTGIIFNIAAIILILLFSFHKLTVIIWIIYSINTFGLFIINKFWKISAHAIAVSIMLGLFIFTQNQLLILFAFIMVLIVSWSRLKLKVHTPAQVTIGTLYGTIMTLTQLEIYSRVFHVS